MMNSYEEAVEYVAKPKRRMEQAVFVKIVEMAYEMGRADKVKREVFACIEELDRFYDHIRNQRNTRPMRTLRTHTPSETIRSEPFLCNGRQYYHTVYLEYQRYMATPTSIQEKGTITLTVSNSHRDMGCFARKEFATDEEWIDAKNDVKYSYGGAVGYFLWGSTHYYSNQWIRRKTPALE